MVYKTMVEAVLRSLIFSLFHSFPNVSNCSDDQLYAVMYCTFSGSLYKNRELNDLSLPDTLSKK